MTEKYDYCSTVPRTFVEDCSYSGTTVKREIQLRLQALLQEYAAMSHQEAQETIDKWKVLLNKYSLNFSLHDKTHRSRGQSQGSHSLVKSFEFQGKVLEKSLNFCASP